MPKSLPTASAGTSSTSTCTLAASAAQPWLPRATEQLLSHLLYHVLCSKLSGQQLIRNISSEHSGSTRLPSPFAFILLALLCPPLPSLRFSKSQARKLKSHHNHLSLLSFPPLNYANTTAKHPVNSILALFTLFYFQTQSGEV